MPKSTEATLNGSPAIADAQLQLAIAYADQRDLESARRHAQLAAAQATPDWPNLESLGVLLFQLSRFSAARRLLTQAEQNRPLGSEALKMLAALYRRSGETAKARHCIAAWVQLDAIAAPTIPIPTAPTFCVCAR